MTRGSKQRGQQQQRSRGGKRQGKARQQVDHSGARQDRGGGGRAQSRGRQGDRKSSFRDGGQSRRGSRQVNAIPGGSGAMANLLSRAGMVATPAAFPQGPLGMSSSLQPQPVLAGSAIMGGALQGTHSGMLMPQVGVLHSQMAPFNGLVGITPMVGALGASVAAQQQAPPRTVAQRKRERYAAAAASMPQSPPRQQHTGSGGGALSGILARAGMFGDSASAATALRGRGVKDTAWTDKSGSQSRKHSKEKKHDGGAKGGNQRTRKAQGAARSAGRKRRDAQQQRRRK